MSSVRPSGVPATPLRRLTGWVPDDLGFGDVDEDTLELPDRHVLLPRRWRRIHPQPAPVPEGGGSRVATPAPPVEPVAVQPSRVARVTPDPVVRAYQMLVAVMLAVGIAVVCLFALTL